MPKLRNRSKTGRRHRAKASARRSAKHKGGAPYDTEYDPYSSQSNPYNSTQNDPYSSQSNPYNSTQNDPYSSQSNPYSSTQNDPYSSQTGLYNSMQNDPYSSQTGLYNSTQNDPYSSQTGLYNSTQNDPYSSQTGLYNSTQNDPYSSQTGLYNSSAYGTQPELKSTIGAQNTKNEYDYLDMPEFNNFQNKEPEWNANTDIDTGVAKNQSQRESLNTMIEDNFTPAYPTPSAAITPSSLPKYDNDDDNYIFNVPTKIKIPHLRSIPRRLKNLAKRATHKIAKRARNYASRTKNAVMSLIGRRKNIGGKTRRRHK